MYENNDFKFVVVLDAKVPIGQLMNALSHIVAGLVSLGDLNQFRFLKYVDGDDTNHPAISFYPFIILKAKNSNQIRKLRNDAIKEGILYNDFTSSMLGFSAEDQMQKTRETKEAELEYFGIALFGEAKSLNVLTKRFSLFSLPTSAE